MELFIESPQRRAERAERERRALAARQKDQNATFDLDEPDYADQAAALDASKDCAERAGGAKGVSNTALKVPAAEAYRAELAFDRRRARRRKLGAVLRVLAAALLIPVAVVLVFLASYALTYILNGASPQQLTLAMTALFEHARALAYEVMQHISLS